MKRYRFWLVGAFVVVTAALVGAIIKRNQNPLYQLSQYPQTPELERYRREITKDIENPVTVANKAIIQVDAPLYEDFKLLFSYRIGQNATFTLNPFSVGHFHSSSGRTVNLNSQQFAEVKRLMKQLPSSQPPDKREDLMIVLIYAPAPPQIRLYNRKHPPAQLRAILRIAMEAAERDFRNSNSQRPQN